MSFCEDILRYLEDDAEGDYETNQHYVGMKELFRGYAVLAWLGINFRCTRCKKLNKIIVLRYAEYCNECWINHNEILHDETKQRNRLKKWFENEKRRSESSEHR